MGSVYKHALLNIAATSVTDGDEGIRGGFFRPRSSSMVAPIRVAASYDYGRGKKGSVDYHLASEQDWSDGVTGAGLNRRAWVMQERHMSPRILHFAASQVWWECNATVCSETYPNGDPMSVFRNPHRSKDFLQQLATLTQDQEVPRDTSPAKFSTDVACLWYDLLSVYSQGRLTMARDKLVAISGIAKELQSHARLHAQDYLAGLWRQDLPYGLLWATPVISLSATQRIRPDPQQHFQAPSWSWASVNCGISVNRRLYNEPHEVLATVESIEVMPKTDPFGEIQPRGFLKLRGTEYKGHLKYSRLHGRIWTELQIGASTYSMKFKGSFAVMPDERYIEGETPSSTDVCLLPVLKSKQKTTWNRQREVGGAWLVMLMLEATANPSEYRRCGLVELKGNGSDTALDHWSPIMRMQRRPREEIVSII